MKINEIKDLELIKNALENYIPNAEEAVKILIDSTLPKSIIETTEYNIRRGKELIEELNNEILGVVKEKVEDKITNGELIEVVLDASENGHLKRVQDEYLSLSKGELGVPVELGKFSYSDWDKFIEYNIKFKVEFLTFPSWAGKFKYIKINRDLYTHIKLKILIID